MKTLYISALCLLILSCKQKPATFDNNESGDLEPAQQYRQYIEDTTLKTDMIMPSGIAMKLSEEKRFQGERFDTSETRYKYGLTQYLRNDRFDIELSYSGEGQGYFMVIEDRLTNIREDRTYYANDQVSSVEYRLNGYSTKTVPVGIWKYYNPGGDLDSIRDHDGRFRVSYSQARAMAEKKGFAEPGVKFSHDTVQGRIVWEIIRNCYDEVLEPEAILMDVQTGIISKRDSVYCWDTDVSKG